MATLTNEQIEQKIQQLKQLTEEVNALSKELAEAGAIELSDEDLDKATGGNAEDDIKKKQESVERRRKLSETRHGIDFSRNPFKEVLK